MKVLFVHQNFPGHFRALAPALAARGDTVVAMGMGQFTPPPGIRYVRSTPAYGTATNGHPWTRDFDTKVIRGDATFRSAIRLRNEGFEPDVIVAHPGWGESLFLKIVWPRAKLGIFCEFFYSANDADVDFDPEFRDPDRDGSSCQILIKNAAMTLQLQNADAGLSSTRWQADSFPASFRDRITVVHEGVDTARIRRDPATRLTLNSAITIAPGDEIITLMNRWLEPYRGYHVFMRALPELLRRRPNARVIITGGDGAGYGPAPPTGQTWRQIFLSEVSDRLDLSRVHFLGNVPFDQFLALLGVSAVHVYLTYPFLLSWSLIEAMAMECAIVASDTPPLHDAIRNGREGLLVPFFDRAALVDAICSLLDDPARRAILGRQARERALAEFSLDVCLPRQIAWVEALKG